MPRPRWIREAVAEAYFQRERLRHLQTTLAQRSLAGALWPERRPEPLLVGYFEAGFGLGQYARGLASALAAVGEPFAAFPFSAYVARGAADRRWVAHYDVEGAHDINIFCMAADQATAARRILGRRRVARSYNILATFWELALAPEAWREAVAAFDEIWAPNRFVADAFRPIFGGPISVVPACAVLDRPAAPDRPRFGLEPARTWFIFTFDYNSYPERKNPLAVVRAFASAFPDVKEAVGLVVKSNGRAEHHPGVAAALAAAASRDPRIRLLHGEFARGDLLALIASADCYVSLHRAEGFGLGMAEAMLLGRPVIGTAYSGNDEFLTEEGGFRVPYRLVAAAPGAYPFAEGQHWAEPDEAAAAIFMRQVHEDRGLREARARRGRAEILARHAPDVVGRIAAARLAAVRERPR